MALISDPSGAHGNTASREANMKLSFIANAAVGAKDVVSINTDFEVDISATDGTAALCIGIAEEAIAANDIGKVAVYGLVQDVSADGSISAGDILKRSVNTAGHVQATATPAQGEAIGVAVNDSASSVVDVFVKPIQDT